MDDSGHADPIDHIDRKVHLRANSTNQSSNPPLMASRVGILRLNGQGNGLDGRFQSLYYPLDRLFAVRNILNYAVIINNLSLFVTDPFNGYGNPDDASILPVILKLMPLYEAILFNHPLKFSAFVRIRVVLTGQVGYAGPHLFGGFVVQTLSLGPDCIK